MNDHPDGKKRPRTDPGAVALAREVFRDALEGTDPSEWETLVRTRCDGNPEALTLVRGLLAVHGRGMGDFLEQPLGLGATPKNIGPYRIDGVLGHGGMGSVYSAYDTRLERDVAIKTLPKHLLRDPSLVRRIEAEARVLAQLNHPHVATIHSLEEWDGIRFFVMEKATGETLDRRLVGQPLPLGEVLEIGRQVASALEAAHGASIVHRDLKPTNVVISPDTRIKVLDFGIAFREGALGETLAPPGSGTPGYMSPEQVAGAEPDPRTDIWALGCLLLECLTGRPHIGGATPEERSGRTRTAELPDPRELSDTVPSWLADLLARCLDPNVTTRLSEMQEVRRSLENGIELRRIEELTERAREREPEIRHNLPFALTEFIGRNCERQQLGQGLREVRCLTVTGLGGSGKTRLAIEVARESAAHFTGGLWFCDLSATVDGTSLARRVASALGLKDQASTDALAGLAEFFGDGPNLLLLDNCDPILEECAELVERLLGTIGHLTVLATSREAMKLPGERTFPLGPLATDLDAPGVRGVPEEPSESVRLFLARAQEADPSCGDGREVAELADSICRRLGGIPLAIELAAAQLRATPLRELASRLDENLSILSRGVRRSSARHATLAAALAWTLDTLSEETQSVFARLSIFRGGWTAESAEQLLTDPVNPAWAVHDRMAELVEKSLVVREVGADPSMFRYRYLEVVREHAGELLADSGKHKTLAECHREYFVSWAEHAAEFLSGPDQVVWLHRIEAEHDNLRQALTLSEHQIAEENTDDPGVLLRLPQALAGFWALRGHWREGVEWSRSLLEAMEPLPASVQSAAVLNSTGILHQHLAEFDDAHEVFQRSLEMSRTLHDRSGMVQSLGNLGVWSFFTGRRTECRTYLEEVATLCEGIGDRGRLANTRMNLGVLAYTSGDCSQAERDLSQALEHYRALGDVRNIGRCSINLGNVYYRLADFKRARESHDESLRVAREVGDQVLVISSLTGLGNVSQGEGNLEHATENYQEALDLSRELEDPVGVGRGLHNLGSVASDQGDVARARMLFEDSLKVRREVRDEEGVAESSLSLGRLLREFGEAESGRRAVVGSLKAYRRLGQALETARAIEELCWFDSSISARERRELLNAADRLRAESQSERTDRETANILSLREKVADQLGLDEDNTGTSPFDLDVWIERLPEDPARLNGD